MIPLERIDALSDSGMCLSVAERAGLEVAMVQRTNDEGFKALFFWGKITGTSEDYLICYGLLPSYDYPQKKFFFCTTNNYTLQQMPVIDAEMTQKAEAVEGMFVGEPDKPLEEVPEDAEDPEAAAKNVFREEHRLAQTVLAIDFDTSTCPKGAFLVAPSKQVGQNTGFVGLDYEAAGQLSSYYHLRAATGPEPKAALDKPGLVRSTDFLDSLASDAASSWSLQYNSSKTSSTLRSLVWPGYFFYHQVSSSNFGGAYFGTGQKNTDLAFMI
jgi:radial spoke head protein 9